MQMCCLFVGYDLHPLLRLASGDLKSWQRTLGREHNYVELIHGSNMVLVMWLLQVYWPILLAYFILLLAPCLQHVVTECLFVSVVPIDHEMSACLDMSVWNFQLKCQLFFLYRVDSWGFDNEGQGEAYDQTQARSSNIHELPCYPHPPIGLVTGLSLPISARYVPFNFGKQTYGELSKVKVTVGIFFLWQQVDGKLCATKCAGSRREERQMMEVDRRGWVLADVLKGIRQQKIWFTLARIARSARLMRLFST